MSEIYKSYDKVGIKDRSMIWNSYVLFLFVSRFSSPATFDNVQGGAWHEYNVGIEC